MVEEKKIVIKATFGMMTESLGISTWNLIALVKQTHTAIDPLQLNVSERLHHFFFFLKYFQSVRIYCI